MKQMIEYINGPFYYNDRRLDQLFYFLCFVFVVVQFLPISDFKNAFVKGMLITCFSL